MSKLEDIKELLRSNPDLAWNEQTTRRPYLRADGTYYSHAFRVAPKEPILTSKKLQSFSKYLTELLKPIGPTNITMCYEYPGPKRSVIKTSTVYYVETIEDEGKDRGKERRLTVSIYPCQTMAENMGIRGLIDIKRYLCPELCKQSKKCTFKAPRRTMPLDIG
ncbi:MAG: hypothetical protein SVM79_05090 [Chloroflexota bacterium]|nr:hypothetical protein [Chloroflexota bacterium]